MGWNMGWNKGEGHDVITKRASKKTAWQERSKEPIERERDGLRDKAMTAKRERYQNRIELLQGTLDLLILQTLQWGPQHGYGIAQAIRATSSDVLQVDTGSLYPALHRLERRTWIAASWKVSDNKQRTRVYRLTAAGRRQLQSERSKWAQLVEAMGAVLNGTKRSEA